MKSKPSELDLAADEIVTAAVEIFRESGLEAVSMRSVSSRLGVSPVPLYSRVGNKESLVDAIADRVLGNPAPPVREGEDWAAYAVRWARALRNRLRLTRDSRLMVPPDRAGYVQASRPLVEAMRVAGMADDAAVQACRLVMWATVGFATVESGASQRERPKGRRRGRPGGDPTGVDRQDIDALFDMHIRYLIEGISSDQTERSTGR
ncbi:MAG TPA: TetR family transcriptional regulator [Acidimicrobiales bacterium]|nr:TetR family transcriptional regulator [Acidimicrobiales bacterium]